MKTIEIADIQDNTEPGIPNILEVFDGLKFPVSKAELVDYAQDHDASEEVLDLIQGMPEQDYSSLSEVNRLIGAIDELPGSENMWSSEESHDLPDADANPKTGSLNKL